MAILVMWPGPFEQAFIPPSQGGSKWNLASISLVVTEEKKFKILNLSDLDQGQWMILTFGIHLVDCIYKLLYHRLL